MAHGDAWSHGEGELAHPEQACRIRKKTQGWIPGKEWGMGWSDQKKELWKRKVKSEMDEYMSQVVASLCKNISPPSTFLWEEVEDFRDKVKIFVYTKLILWLPADLKIYRY